MDYSTMFRMYDAATPNASVNAGTPQKGLSEILADPSLQTAAFQIASALDPEGFGGRLAKAGLQMRQAKSLSQGMTKAQTPQTQTPTAPPAPIPATSTNLTGNDYVGKAKQMAKLATMLKEAATTEPSVVPTNYAQDFTKALAASPQIQNPTQPVAGNAGQTAGNWENPAPALELDPSLAMSMTPEQIQQVFSHNIAKGTYDLARAEEGRLAAKTAWDMSPERHRQALEVAGEPSRAAAERYKEVTRFNVSMADEFIKNNPDAANIELPTGMTLGQALTMSASNGDAGKAVNDLINSALDYKAAIYSANQHYAAAKLRAAQDHESVEFYKKHSLFEKYNKDANTKLVSIEDWNKMTPEERWMTEAKPRTPEAEKSLRLAEAMRDKLGRDLYGPAYDEMLKASQKLENHGKDADLEVDMTELEKLMDEYKNKGGGKSDRGASRSFAPDPQDLINSMFNPGYSGGYN